MYDMSELCKLCNREDGLWGDSVCSNTELCRNCIHYGSPKNNFVPKVGIENERAEYDRLKKKFGD